MKPSPLYDFIRFYLCVRVYARIMVYIIKEQENENENEYENKKYAYRRI